MYQCLLEVGFEAEVSTKEDPELLELAEEICNEHQATRAAAITELRKMLFERKQCHPYRTDDEFLLRFLRARDFIVPRAHKLLVRYCKFREEHSNLYKGVDLWDLAKVKSAYLGTMIDHPDTGRLSIMRFGEWDPSEFPIDELVKAALAMTEIGLRQPKLQVFGGTAIFDLEGITLKHFTSLTPTVAYQLVSLLGIAIPCRVRACHIINYNWMFNTFFYLFKKFIPQHAWGAIHFHGSDLKSLQQHISLECLPKKYGGTCRTATSFDVWIKKLKKYRDEKFDKDMKGLGYVIKE